MEIFPHIQAKLPLMQLRPFLLDLKLITLRENTESHLTTTSFQAVLEVMRSTWSLLLSRLNNHSFLSYSSIRLMTSFVFPSTVLPNNPACRPLCTQQLQRSSCQVASWLLLPRFWCRTLRVLATPRIHLKKKKKKSLMYTTLSNADGSAA